tara:strand:- start:45 stop:725 length:681 start_codon:yes stop_codon:yes gene_type:complete
MNAQERLKVQTQNLMINKNGKWPHQKDSEEYFDGKITKSMFMRMVNAWNKPKWIDAPKWSNFLSQDKDGEWNWSERFPDRAPYGEGWDYREAGSTESCGYGGKVFNWCKTAQERPNEYKFSFIFPIEYWDFIKKKWIPCRIVYQGKKVIVVQTVTGDEVYREVETIKTRISESFEIIRGELEVAIDGIIGRTNISISQGMLRPANLAHVLIESLDDKGYSITKNAQ